MWQLRLTACALFKKGEAVAERERRRKAVSLSRWGETSQGRTSHLWRWGVRRQVILGTGFDSRALSIEKSSPIVEISRPWPHQILRLPLDGPDGQNLTSGRRSQRRDQRSDMPKPLLGRAHPSECQQGQDHQVA